MVPSGCVTWRLSEGGPNSFGLSCTGDGLFLGRTPLFERRDGQYAVRDRAELERLFTAAYGIEIGVEARMAGFNLVAKAVNDNNLCLATIAAVSLCIPDLPNHASRVVIELEDRVLKFERVGLFAKVGRPFDPDLHPRQPSGQPDGGQFADAGGSGGGSSNPSIHQVSDEPTPGMGHNEGPPLEPPPELPDDEPSTAKLKNKAIKAVAKWAAKALLRSELGPIGDLWTLYDTASWLYDNRAYIESYLDGPKSLDELQQNVSNPQKGYEIHHIAEQTPAERDGHDRSLIDSPENLVRIPTLKHWELTGWYMRPNSTYGGVSPRAYLRGKNWTERQDVGRKGLIAVGVLKP